MRNWLHLVLVAAAVIAVAACAGGYESKPLRFKLPSGYSNATKVAGAVVGAEAFVDSKEAKGAFGFDIRKAGLLPVQVVFDNQGTHPLEINGVQTFLEDEMGNLWPILPSDTAYERTTKYTRTKRVFKEGAYGSFLGASAGAIIGAAVGIVTEENVGATLGKGAAAGAAAGATLGGVKGYTSNEARREITHDLRGKSLQNRAVDPGNLAHGFLFFPGEATSAKQLRLQLLEVDTGTVHVLTLAL
ncbi:MAG: hypothetical protein ACLFVT_03565 [Syntrophobacteria bacterium]